MGCQIEEFGEYTNLPRSNKLSFASQMIPGNIMRSYSPMQLSYGIV